jgi:hypothetical protein
LNFIERKLVNALLLGAVPDSHFIFVKSQDPKGQKKFVCMTDIPAIPCDALAYGVACLQFMDSSFGV